ncbi:vegetative cell wall protein gp1-like isoform X1 [Gracilaria domingensis]|nr:vegetative cell wall protein gp1-like isoform X1 [Gracilaria domingensis]
MSSPLSTKCFRRLGQVKLSRTLESKNCINSRVRALKRGLLYDELQYHNLRVCRVYKARLARQSSHVRRIHQSTKKLQRQKDKKEIGQLGLSLISQVQPIAKGRMKGFLENDLAEEYERLRHAIGQPEYDSFPPSTHQPITEEELLQVAQPLTLGDEHQGEANYDALEERNRAEENEDRGGRGNGDEEEPEMVTEEEEAVGNTRGGTTRSGLKEAVKEGGCSSPNDGGDANGGEEVEDVDVSPQSPPSADEEADKADDNHSGSQDEFDWLIQGGEGTKAEETEVSTQREIAAHGSGKDDGKGFLIQPQHPLTHQQSSPRFVRRYEVEEKLAVQVDLEGNLTSATRRELEFRQASEAEVGEVQEVNNLGPLPEFPSALDEKMTVGTVRFPHYTSQCPAAALNDVVGNVLEATSSSLCEGQAPFEVDDFFISSPQKPARNPLSFPASLPLAAPARPLPQRPGPPPSPLRPTPPQPGSVPPPVQPSRVIPCGPAPSAVQPPVAMNPSALVTPCTQRRETPIKGESKPGSEKALGVQKPPMKGIASRNRAGKACHRIAQRMSEVGAGKPVFTQNGGRVRIVKMPRPTVPNFQPLRPPRYPTPLPSVRQPAPVPSAPPHDLEDLQRDLCMRTRQPGTASSHEDLLKLLDAFTNLPPRQPNSNGMFRATAPGFVGNRVPAVPNSAIPASDNANTAMRVDGGPGCNQVAQGPAAEAVAASPGVQSPTGRRSVKRKLELTAEERQEKKRIRAMRNRQSAEKSRRRRKVYATALESNVQTLREQSQEWRCRHIAGLRRLSEMQRDIRAIYGDNHNISTPEMHEVVDMVGDMVRRCPYTFKREEPAIELRSTGEDGRRGGRGGEARGGRGRGAGRGGRGNRGGRGG